MVRPAARTVTVKLQVLLLPEASVAVQVTLVVPMGKVEPLGGLQVAVTFEQLSVAVAVQVTLLLEQWPGSELTVMLSVQRITAFCASPTTVTCKHQSSPTP